MYLTSGKTPTGTRVLTLFPAITKQTMNDTKIPQLSSSSRDTLQLYTFNPPFAKLPAPKNPGEGTPYPTIPGLGSPICSGSGSAVRAGGWVVAGAAAVGLPTSIGGYCPFGDTDGTGLALGPPGTELGGCYGSQVDYSLLCTDSSDTLICGGNAGASTDYDPLGVCKNGAISLTLILDVPAGTNPCDELAKRYKIYDSYTPLGEIIDNQISHLWNNFNGGAVQCVVNVKPC